MIHRRRASRETPRFPRERQACFERETTRLDRDTTRLDRETARLGTETTRLQTDGEVRFRVAEIREREDGEVENELSFGESRRRRERPGGPMRRHHDRASYQN